MRFYCLLKSNFIARAMLTWDAISCFVFDVRNTRFLLLAFGLQTERFYVGVISTCQFDVMFFSVRIWKQKPCCHIDMCVSETAGCISSLWPRARAYYTGIEIIQIQNCQSVWIIVIHRLVAGTSFNQIWMFCLYDVRIRSYWQCWFPLGSLWR